MKKIIVVDDDKDLLLLIKTFLQKFYDTRIFDNAGEGQEAIYDFLPDLIILDVNIGQDDGRNICALIKQDSELKDTPVILISGDSAMLKNNGNCGADHVILKPFLPAKLLTAIADQLDAA